MTAAYTSATAHREHVLDGKATSQRQRILNYLIEKDALANRSELARAFQASQFRNTWDDGPDIPLASICGRLNTLISSGLVRVVDEQEDPRTGHRVQMVEAVRPEPKQRSFEAFR